MNLSTSMYILFYLLSSKLSKPNLKLGNDRNKDTEYH